MGRFRSIEPSFFRAFPFRSGLNHSFDAASIAKLQPMKKAVGVVVVLASLAGIVWWNRGGLKEQRGLESITVPEGFAVEMASKPGLVKYPMLGTIAPDGIIYMCESSGRTYGKTPEMTADPTYVVTKIEDTDGDGTYDKSTVFADKLTLPAGAVWYKDSLYVAAALPVSLAGHQWRRRGGREGGCRPGLEPVGKRGQPARANYGPRRLAVPDRRTARV
jgi:hypothetical protein